MTVQHDEQPLTRREIRERERLAAERSGAAAADTTAPETPAPTGARPGAGASRRASVSSPTAGGAEPDVSVTVTPVVDAPRAQKPEATGSGTPSAAPKPPAPVTLPPMPRAMTRRELRALQAENSAAAPVAPTAPASPAAPDAGAPRNAPVAGAPVTAPSEARATAKPESDTSRAPSILPVRPPATIADQPRADRADASAAASAAAVAKPTASPAPAAVPEPKLNTALFAGIGNADLVEEKATEITGSFDPPIEHLQITEELDNKSRDVDDAASFDDLIAQGVSATGAVTTTNALIMPSVPNGAELRRPVTERGEILVTGSIDLPRGLGATGQHPNRYDTSDVDRLLDQVEPERPASESSPVRASSAISTHTSTRGVVAPPQRQRINSTVVLAITAAVLLVGVIVVVVGGFVFNIF